MKRRIYFAFSAIAILTAATAHAAPPQYSVQPLQNMDLFGLFGMNNYGQIVGFDGFGAAVWTPNAANGTTGITTQLPGSDFTGLAAGINDLGQVVGRRSFNTAVLWNPTAVRGVYQQPTDLPVNGTGPSIAYSINSTGQVVGQNGSSLSQSFLWNPSSPNGQTGSALILPRLPGAAVGAANSINDRGQVAGWSGGAYLWQPTAPNAQTGAINNLNAAQSSSGYINLINEAGWITGQYESSGTSRAFVWRPSTPNAATGSLTPLPGLAGSTNLLPTGINDAGFIVGYQPGGIEAFLWTPQDGTLNLDEVLDPSSADWHISSAHAINDQGHILAYAAYTPPGGGSPTGGPVLLVPVPEPVTSTFMCAAFAAMSIARRRLQARETQARN